MENNLKDIEALITMFETEGWSVFKRDMTELHDALLSGAPSSCKTSEDWQFMRGQLGAMNRLVHLEEYTRSVQTSILEGDEDADL